MFRLITTANEIPDGATVTRPTGSKKYQLIREIRFFPRGSEAGDRHSVTPIDGCVFLMNDTDTDVSVYPPTAKLAWLASAVDLYRIVDPIINPEMYEDK